MLEILVPAFQCRIQIRTDGFYTSATAASGLTPYGVFEFIEAFLAWPFPTPFKMVAQEVESSSLAGIYFYGLRKSGEPLCLLCRAVTGGLRSVVAVTAKELRFTHCFRTRSSRTFSLLQPV